MYPTADCTGRAEGINHRLSPSAAAASPGTAPAAAAPSSQAAAPHKMGERGAVKGFASVRVRLPFIVLKTGGRKKALAVDCWAQGEMQTQTGLNVFQPG